ncbi:MAG: polysaccharide deacetylase family protein [Chthoniobacterales bacterium]
MEAPPRDTNPMRAALLLVAFAAPVLSLVLALRGAPLVLALAPLFASHLLLLYPTLVPSCQWWGPVFTHFKTAEREVWLTIDDGPSPAHTIAMLDLLAQFDARATFFVVGAKAETHPHLITEILTRGHALANHTFSHPARSFWCAGPARVRREIARCAETLRTAPERPADFFRAPAGFKNMFVHPVLAQRGLGLIGWKVRGLDTVKRNAQQVAERIEKGAMPGAIILLHEGHHTARDPEFGLQCLELTLQRLSARGYRCILPQPEQLRC